MLVELAVSLSLYIEFRVEGSSWFRVLSLRLSVKLRVVMKKYNMYYPVAAARRQEAKHISTAARGLHM